MFTVLRVRPNRKVKQLTPLALRWLEKVAAKVALIQTLILLGRGPSRRCSTRKSPSSRAPL